MLDSEWQTKEDVPDWAMGHVRLTDDGTWQLEVRAMVPGKIYDEFRRNNRILFKENEKLKETLKEHEDWISPQAYAVIQGKLQANASKEDIRRFEDARMTEVSEWTEVHAATVYQLLYARGMNLEKAKQVRRQARLTG